jgi:hypothetical protein
MIDVFSAAYVTQDRRDHEAIVMIAADHGRPTS